MPIEPFSTVGKRDTLEQLKEIVAQNFEVIEHLLNGGLDSLNVKNIAGYNVSKTELKHKSGIVGMSGEDPNNPDAVRFWAGDADKEAAPFRVTQEGLLTAIGALFMSALGYPKLELNVDGNLLKASKDADNWIAINPDLLGNPTVHFNYADTVEALIFSALSTFALNTTIGNIQILAQSGDVRIGAGFGKKVKFDDWESIQVISDGTNLQQQLNSKLSALIGESGTVYVSSTPGGPTDKAIFFSSGQRIT